MKPHLYKEYSKIFDFFSDPELFPELAKFMQTVASYLPQKAAVTDAGGGTGFCDKQLLDLRPDIKLSVIEPSSDMFPIAKLRLENLAQLFPMTLDKALPLLSKQDAFIFQRSLYAIYQNEDYCQKLFFQLREKLLPGGLVFIYEFKEKTQPQEMWDYLEPIFKQSPKDYPEFLARWDAFADTLEVYNKGVDNGEYHIFTSEELDALFAKAGFIKRHEGYFDYVYQLPGSKPILAK